MFVVKTGLLRRVLQQGSGLCGMRFDRHFYEGFGAGESGFITTMQFVNRTLSLRTAIAVVLRLEVFGSLLFCIRDMEIHVLHVQNYQKVHKNILI